MPSTVDAGRDKILEVLLIDGDPRAILLVEIAMAEAARDSRTRVRISWTRTLADGIAELERSGPDLDAKRKGGPKGLDSALDRRGKSR